MSVEKVTDIFGRKDTTVSVEFFPPKSEKGAAKVFETAQEFAYLGVDFFAITYGAGGSTNVSTLQYAADLQDRFNIPVIHHLTCVKHTRDELRELLGKLQTAGIRNVLAMRGDPPADEPGYVPSLDEPKFGYELVQIVREFGDAFACGVPGFPEGHTQTPTKELDSEYLRIKQDSGADFVITQLFFDNRDYYQYIDRCKEAGVTIRLIPGILPITDYYKLLKFCKICGATMHDSIRDAFEPIADDPEAVYEKGIEVVTAQCKDLLAAGAPGLHFFCMNHFEPVRTIWKSLDI